MSRSFLTAVLACSVVACVPSLDGNTPREPNKNVPASFGGAHGDPAAAAPPAAGLFDDAELRALVETGLGKNLELSSRAQEIVIARNELSARRGDYLPRVNAFAGAGVEKVGKHTSQGASDEATGLPENLGNFTFGLSGSWEVDVWKRLRSAAQAADLRYLASVEARNFVVTQIVAEIARAYYGLVAVDDELEVLERNIEVQADALEVVKVQKQAARVTELAVQRFEAEVLKNRSRLYELQQERVQTENRINFLLGRYPQPVARSARKLVDRGPGAARAGLPSQLLERRPDVRQAELELSAAKLDVKAAKAAFYPALSIDAGVGYRAFSPAHLVATPESLVYGVAGNLTAPLLNRTAIAAQYRSANARQLQAVYRFEATLLQAFTDVVNQLAKIDNLEKSYELQSEQVAALVRSSEVSSILFQSARADYMEVLLTRRDSLEGEMTRIETKRRQLEAMVDLYQALGGGRPW